MTPKTEEQQQPNLRPPDEQSKDVPNQDNAAPPQTGGEIPKRALDQQAVGPVAKRLRTKGTQGKSCEANPTHRWEATTGGTLRYRSAAIAIHQYAEQRAAVNAQRQESFTEQPPARTTMKDKQHQQQQESLPEKSRAQGSNQICPVKQITSSKDDPQPRPTVLIYTDGPSDLTFAEKNGWRAKGSSWLFAEPRIAQFAVTAHHTMRPMERHH